MIHKSVICNASSSYSVRGAVPKMASSDEEDLQSVLVLGIILRRRRRRAIKKSQQYSWVRLILQKRRKQGEYNNFSQEMRFSG